MCIDSLRFEAHAFFSEETQIQNRAFRACRIIEKANALAV